jgi:heme-degrading monooxygenase HmoA
MFARVLEITPKLEKKDELIKTIRQEVLPLLRKQPGFLEMLPFMPEGATQHALSITLWTEKRDAERYVRDVFPKVEQILKPFLTAPAVARMFTVETTLCKHWVESVSAAA